MDSEDVSEDLRLLKYTVLGGELGETISSKMPRRVNQLKNTRRLPIGCGDFSDTLFWG